MQPESSSQEMCAAMNSSFSTPGTPPSLPALLIGAPSVFGNSPGSFHNSSLPAQHLACLATSDSPTCTCGREAVPVRSGVIPRTLHHPWRLKASKIGMGISTLVCFLLYHLGEPGHPGEPGKDGMSGEKGERGQQLALI